MKWRSNAISCKELQHPITIIEFHVKKQKKKHIDRILIFINCYEILQQIFNLTLNNKPNKIS